MCALSGEKTFDYFKLIFEAIEIRLIQVEIWNFSSFSPGRTYVKGKMWMMCLHCGSVCD